MSSNTPDTKAENGTVPPEAAATPSATLRIEQDGRTFVLALNDGTEPASPAEPKPPVVPAIEDTPEALNAAIDAHEKGLKDSPPSHCLDLSGSTLSRATLEAGNWVNRNLKQANFGTADIGGLDFTDSDLTDADLSSAQQLEPQQFAGAVLKRAKLPEKFEFPQLATTEEMSKNCGKYFLTILSACAFMLLTALSTKDAALISDSTTSTLPILQTSVSIVKFYFWAPLVLLAVYGFYLINLQDLWKMMATLPAVFQDGRDVGQSTYPWVVNRAAAYYSKRIPNTANDTIVHTLTMALAYWSVPATGAVIWIHAIRRHDVSLSNWFHLSGWHSLTIALSIYLSLVGMRTAIAALKRSRFLKSLRSPFAGILGKPFNVRSLKGVTWHFLATLLCCAIGLLFIRISYAIVNDSTPWLTAFLRRANISTNIDVDSANVSTRPEKWIGTKQEDYEAIAGANLRGQDLRHLNGEHAFLVNADLRGSDLTNADLGHADLRGANLSVADRADVYLRSSFAISATLKKSVNAPAPFPRLHGARLDSVDLVGARIDYGILDYATLTNAILIGTNLTNAQLSGANLTNANLNNANLTESDLGGANLTNAHLNYANFTITSLRNADLRGADLRYADNLGPSQIFEAFGDDTTKLDQGLRPKNNPHWPHKLTDEQLISMRGY